MRKKNEVTLYDGGLIVLLVFVCIVVVAVGQAGQEAKEIRRKCEERLAREKIAISSYADDELITNYYQIDAELEGALDDLESARRGAGGGFAEGFLRAYKGGVTEECLIKIKVDTLRQIRALYLTEIAKRGVKLAG